MGNNELTKLLQDVVLKNEKPARDVATEINKPYPTLLREINPEDKGAKVGIEELVPLMRSTGSIRPLTRLANIMGYVLVPMDINPGDPDEANYMALDLMDGFGRYSKALKSALQADPKEDLVSIVEQEGFEAITAILTMVHYLRKRAEEEKTKNAPRLAQVS
ncbi:phage regulatory CII family protein [Desulfovibrio gilichinskyi]|uniref:Phage regulatory protein CII (CP76) n=1 Tax=Desulfovibrio gilichinskyi TaxID=1519643 RepID=A0A1X7EFD3_9BACT|nr:phage regulatory CII family protein [Desulfovibrio gilichinskyi]SMF32943.1 hypothetical protein SAMN06295933_2876 [Desulfovibrio gilichinskyi]